MDHMPSGTNRLRACWASDTALNALFSCSRVSGGSAPRVDPVVRRGSGVHLGGLVLEAKPRHERERLEERGDRVVRERAGVVGGA